MSQRLLITLVSAAATGLALVLNLGNYQNFLYLLGSFFVPLFGVLVADWLAAGAHYTEASIFRAPALRVPQLGAWIVGFCLYQWLSPVGPVWWTRHRRAHASRQRELHRLAAELRRLVRDRARVLARRARQCFPRSGGGTRLEA